MKKQNEKKDRYHISTDFSVSPPYGTLGNAKIRTNPTYLQKPAV